jgi:hypothetical protein
MEENDIVLVTSLDEILPNPAALTRETNSVLSKVSEVAALLLLLHD